MNRGAFDWLEIASLKTIVLFALGEVAKRVILIFYAKVSCVVRY